MQLGSRDVEKMLMNRHGVLDDRRLAFRGRFDRLRKLGCPSGVQTGKGRPALYGWSQIVELAVALDLIDLGLPPELVAATVEANGQMLRAATWLLVEGLDPPAFAVLLRGKVYPIERTYFFLIHPNALAHLSNDGQHVALSIGPVPGLEFVERLLKSDEPCVAVVLDLGSRIADLIRAAAAHSALSFEEIGADFLSWIDDHDVNS